MKIIITGGAGFIGSNLIREIIETTDYQVLNLDKLTYAGNLDSLSDLSDDPRYEFAQVDICDLEKVRETIMDYQPDAIMHLAAESHVDRSIDGPLDFINTNIIGTYNLLQASLEYWRKLPEGKLSDGRLKIENRRSENKNLSSAICHLSSETPTKLSFRFLHVSTDEVYGSLGETGLFREDTAYDPRSPYSSSKASSDHLVSAWYHTYGLPVLTTNCSNNYGPYQFPEKLIPVVILKCLKGESIPVYGKGENIRDWLYVRDHARALLTVLENGRLGETYNIGGNNERRNIDLVNLLCELMDDFCPEGRDRRSEIGGQMSDVGDRRSEDLKPKTSNLKPIKSYKDLITFVTDRPGHDMRYAIDASKIKNELGWEPSETFETGFRKTVKWYLENRKWWEDILSGDYQLDRIGKADK